jgi:hypothetical protein
MTASSSIASSTASWRRPAIRRHRPRRLIQARPSGRVLEHALRARHARHGAHQNPNSANSQFFITFGRTPHLNGQYTVWGRVVEGMEHVDAIARGEPPRNPDSMLQVRVLADIEG